MTENNTEIIEIAIKVIFLGEFKDYESWKKNYDSFLLEYGMMAPFLHYDCTGFATTGYILKNFEKEKPYPVKIYLQVTDPGTAKPLSFKSTSNN